MALLVLPGLAHANDLMRVYALAVQNDASFRAARHARDAAIEARPQARAALLPQIGGSYGYSESREKGTEAFQNLPETPIDRDSTNRGLTITLNQAVFDWAAFQRLRQSGEQVALANTTLRNAEQQLLLRTAEAYFAVLSATDALRSSQAEQQAVERQLEQAKKRFEVGLSAITDVQEAQARYDLTVARVLEAEQALAQAREALTEITGEATAGIAPLREEFPLPTPQPTEVGHWVEAAKQGNLDVLAARHAAEIAARGVDVARSGHLPTLGAQLQYQDFTAEGSRFSGQTESESVTLQLNVPIFAGGATRSGVRQAIATREQRRSELDAQERLVERNTRDAYQGVVTGAARVKAFKQAVVSSRTALQASETGLEVGTRTAVDVLNAQQQLYAAERDYLRSRYDYLLAVLRLKAATGRLTDADLREIDRLLIER
ncbi:TolC family outer membrane protein [Sinimarinibacterium sp. HSW-8]|uniref:TolC family outer membrane protein n=2 Tax=Sinimarinibacterium thermocellulolyticum TaxID=3170016 RepID=A0ABV2ABC8_9GAMM